MRGFKLKRGAIGSTVAHDAHNVVVAGTNDGDYIGSRSLSQAILDAAPRPVGPNGEYAADGKTLKDKVESLEKGLVSEALARLRWNQSKAAEELGLSRVGLANKIKRYGLDRSTP